MGTLSPYLTRVEPGVRSCRVCGCTDDNCFNCIQKTGHPCYWIAPDLCSACKDDPAASAMYEVIVNRQPIPKVIEKEFEPIYKAVIKAKRIDKLQETIQKLFKKNDIQIGIGEDPENKKFIFVRKGLKGKAHLIIQRIKKVK